MNAPSGRARAFAALGLVMLLWAGNSIIARAVRFDVPPFTLALLRWAGEVAAIGELYAAAIAAQDLRRLQEASRQMRTVPTLYAALQEALNAAVEPMTRTDEG